MKIGQYETHPAADAWPLMEGSELDALVASVEEHGLRESIKLHEGQILDGRNRAIACERAGRPLRLEMLPADVDPWEYSATINGRRRHIADPAQRTAIVLDLLKQSGGWKILQGEKSPQGDKSSEVQKRTTTPKSQAKTNAPPRRGKSSAAVKAVSEAAGVGAATVERVMEVQAKDPEGFERLKKDGGSARAAVKVAREKQRPPLVAEEPAIPDAIGREVPPAMRDAWRRMQLLSGSFERAFKQMQGDWTVAKRDLEKAAEDSGSALLARFIKRIDHAMTGQSGLRAVSYAIRSEAPYAVCWKCDGAGCQHCDKTGAYVVSSKTAVERALGKT